jgi:hypothetical protein
MLTAPASTKAPPTITSNTSKSARPVSPRSTDQRSYRPEGDAGAASVKIEQILEK